MAQCRDIIDNQQLSKDVCAAGLLYSICFRDGIKALGWTPNTGTDVSRKNLQDARDWLLAHLGTSNTTETIPNKAQNQRFISIHNDTSNINNTKYSRIAKEYDNVTNPESGYEFITVQTLNDSFSKKINFANGTITDIALTNTNTNSSENKLQVSKTVVFGNSFIIREKNMSEITTPDAVEEEIHKRNLIITAS